MGFDCRTSTGLGKQTLQGMNQSMYAPGERSSDPTRDRDRLPVSVQESWVEAWVCSGRCGVRGTEYNSAGLSPLGEVAITAFTHCTYLGLMPNFW